MAVNAAKIATLTARGTARADYIDQHGGSAFDVWRNTAGAGVTSIPLVSTGAGEAGLVSGLSSSWHGSDVGQVGSALKGQGGATLDLAARILGLSDKPRPEGVLENVGAVFGLLTSFEQMLTAPLGLIPFPAFPALRILDMDVGLPHVHNHPPNVVPPAPPIPLPSTGPVIPIPLLSGATRTIINGVPAARCGDIGLGIWCGGYFPMYEVKLGSATVWIEGARAARLLVDITKHCTFSSPKPSDPPTGPMFGMTISGSPNVLIGGIPMPSLTAMAVGAAIKGLFKRIGKVFAARAERAAARAAQEAEGRLTKIAKEVNPANGTENCGFIIDEVKNRLTGADPNAIAPVYLDSAGREIRDGSWQDIANRFNTNFQPGSIEDCFNAVQNGGPGTMGLVKMDGHVVMIANDSGKVAIIEGQGGGAIYDSPAAARSAYDPAGNNRMNGYAILPDKF